MFQDYNILVTVFNNIENEPACEISRLDFPVRNGSKCSVDEIRFQSQGWVLKQRKCEMSLRFPKLNQHKISSGDILHSIMYLPPNFDEKLKYPVVLHIYGGPDYQLVTNTFKVNNVDISNIRVNSLCPNNI